MYTIAEAMYAYSMTCKQNCTGTLSRLSSLAGNDNEIRDFLDSSNCKIGLFTTFVA